MAGTECFVFHSRFDSMIYRYLVTNHRDDMERIKAEEIARMEKDKDDGLLGSMTLPECMDWQLAELFGNQAPIQVTPIDGAYFDDSDIFEELLSDALQKCDFQRIAEAFLAGVELPPYGSLAQGSGEQPLAKVS